MAFQIGKIEQDASYLLADLLELLVAMGADGRKNYSPADMFSILTGTPGIGNFSDPQLKQEIDDAFLDIDYRQKRFGPAYPFSLKKNLLSKKTTQSPGARIYILLLATSRLKSFKNNLRSKWATTFARISRECLSQMMPDNADVRIFDANSDDRRNYYGTNLRNALQKLGDDLRVTHKDDVEIGRHHHAGDAGIDLVGIVSMDDHVEGAFAVLGQCAAQQTNWPEKRFEASPLSFKGVFSFLVDPFAALFIPVAYRDTSGSWLSKRPVSGVLVVDRLRFFLLLGRKMRTSIAAKQWFTDFEAQFSKVANAFAKV